MQALQRLLRLFLPQQQVKNVVKVKLNVIIRHIQLPPLTQLRTQITADQKKVIPYQLQSITKIGYDDPTRQYQ